MTTSHDPLDGANIEIREQVGKDNFFLFGNTTDQLRKLRDDGYDPQQLIASMPELSAALKLIEQGHFSNGDTELFRPIVKNLCYEDPYFLVADFNSYIDIQSQVSKLWSDRPKWNQMSLLNTARSGMFSSDRSIQEYAKKIWGVDRFPVKITCDLNKFSSDVQVDQESGAAIY